MTAANKITGRTVATAVRRAVAVAALVAGVGVLVAPGANATTTEQRSTSMFCAPGWRQGDWAPGVCETDRETMTFAVPSGVDRARVEIEAQTSNSPQKEECAVVTVDGRSFTLCAMNPGLAPKTAVVELQVSGQLVVEAVHLGDQLPPPYQVGDWVNSSPGSMHVDVTVTWLPAQVTTQAPTTQAPTTQAPTTQAPTTQAPTTQAPTTQAPTTQAPTTQAPTTQAPTTQAPTTQAPTTQAPTTQASTTVPRDEVGGETEVLGEVVEPETLPRTGSSSGSSALLGIGLLAGGSLLLLAGRRQPAVDD